MLLQPGLPPIVRDYLLEKSELVDFVSLFPTRSDFSELSLRRKFDSGLRKDLVEAIRSQYGQAIRKETALALQKLSREGTATVVTGHQLCLAGGPLFFAIKIAQTIALARKLEREFEGVSVVPVFWMASEDHDREEVNHLEIFGKKYTWPIQASGPVGKFTTEGIHNTLMEALQPLEREKFFSDALSLVNEYCANPHLADATRNLVDRLFGHYGILVVDGDDPVLKMKFAASMERELKDKSSAPALEKSSSRLRALGYHPQINPREINLFLLDKQQRSRIITSPNGFALADSNRQLPSDEIMNMVRVHPERFSPNVVLRPVYQETVLPNLAVVLGPGELSYWMQLKDVFDLFGCPFPVLIPRDSLYVVDQSLRDRMDRLGMEASAFLQPESLLVRNWLEKQAPLQFQDVWDGFQALIVEAAQRAASVDESLRAAFMAEGSRQIGAWKSLEKKVEKSLKTREAESIKRIVSVQEKLLPDGVPLERREALLRYLAQYGSRFIDELVRYAGSQKEPSVWFWSPEN